MSRRALVLALALGLCACRDPATASGTALLAEITFDETLGVDQLAFTLLDEDGHGLDTALRPDPPGSPLSSPQTLRFLLADALEGRELVLRVSGVRDGVHIATGVGEATVVKDYEVAVSIALSVTEAGGDGGEDGGADGGVDAGADGGLDGGCEPSTFAACGSADGGVCRACDQKLADTCANGECRCGATAECAPGQQCVGGFCVCDTCAPGQRCVSNICVCDDVSCSGGCCDEGVCRQRSPSTCGIMGSTCVSCTAASLADTCSASGSCLCGTNPPCGPGQRCESGSCICDGTSCPDGCCSSSQQCMPGTSNSACGKMGAACQPCGTVSTCVNQACL